MYDASVVTKKGGYVTVTEQGGLWPGILELIDKLGNKRSDHRVYHIIPCTLIWVFLYR